MRQIFGDNICLFSELNRVRLPCLWNSTNQDTIIPIGYMMGERGEAVEFDCYALERFLGLMTPEDKATLLNVYSGGSRVYGNST